MDGEGRKFGTEPDEKVFANVKERDFDLHSSFGPESHEVESMAEQVEKEGRPTTAYEFVQGMVDYQRGESPARIFLIYRDGKRITYNNRKPFDRKGLVAVEFYNGGTGLTPEDLVIIRHGGDQKTRGRWGRGISVTLTYMVSKGMEVEVEANATDKKTGVPNRTWSAKISLEPTESELTQQLKAKGRWLNARSNGITFRVLKPSQEFLDQIDKLPDYFLPANANCDDAAVVERYSGAPKPPIEAQIENPRLGRPARVRCLKGVIKDNDKKAPEVFMDGLKVRDSNAWYKNHYHYPWAIDGTRGLDWPLGVERSFESSQTTEGRPQALIQYALRQSADKKIFEELLTVAEGAAENPLPMELEKESSSGGLDQSVSSQAKQILLEIWQERHQGRLLAKDENALQRAQKKNLGEAVIIRGVMYDWLKEAGVKDVESELGEELKEFKPEQTLEIQYIGDPDALTKLFEEAGECYAEPKVVSADGKKIVQIELPYSISDQSDLYDRTKPGATWARVAAVVGSKLGFKVLAVSQLQDSSTQMEYEISEARGQNQFKTLIKSVTSKAERDLPDGFTRGRTMVTLDGEILQKLEPPPGLAESLRKIAEERAKQKKSWKQGISEKLRGGISAQKEVTGDLTRGDTQMSRRRFGGLLGKGLALAGAGAVVYYWKNLQIPEFVRTLLETRKESILRPGFSLDKIHNHTIGGPEDPLGVHELNYDSRSVKDSRSDALQEAIRFEGKNLLNRPDGYHRLFTGSIFVLNEANGRGQWIQAEEYDEVRVNNDQPSDYTIKVTLPQLNGQNRFPVRSGEAITAIVSDHPVQVLRERRSQNYVLGALTNKDELTVYINKDPQAPNRQPPNEVEDRSVVELKDLNTDWQLFIASVKANSNLTNSQKAALVLAKWGKGYVYADLPELDKQVEGTSAQQIMAQIINTQRGICNTAATGYVGLLREAGVPARTVNGYLVDLGGPGHHMWAEYWDGKAWQEVEPLTGSKMDPRTQSRLFGRIIRSQRAELSEQLEKNYQAVIEKFRQFLEKNPPQKGDQKKKEQEAPTPLRDIGLIGGGAIGGAIAKTLIDRMRLRSKNLKRKQEGKEQE